MGSLEGKDATADAGAAAGAGAADADAGAAASVVGAAAGAADAGAGAAAGAVDAGAAAVKTADATADAGAAAGAADAGAGAAGAGAAVGAVDAGAAAVKAAGTVPTGDLQRTYALTLGYDGAPFAGFARQPGQLTVQGDVEEALSLLFRQQVLTVCAGRTDAGVHARGQVVSFSIPDAAIKGRSKRTLLRSLNALTHELITVKNIEEKPQGFSARFDAVSREYRYHICIDDVPPLFMRDYSWHIPKPLDVEAMRLAAAYLEGEHDFKSFCLAASAKDKTTFRYVEKVQVEPAQVMDENLLVITVKGNAFLHSMVRTMVGTLVKVGAGHREPEWVKHVLAACDRSAAGETAPARGLVFWSVDYEGLRCPYAPGVDAAATDADAATGAATGADAAAGAAAASGAAGASGAATGAAGATDAAAIQEEL